MKKFYYRLMAPGYKEVGKDEEGEPVIWNVAHYSDVKKVYSADEDTARAEIRTKLKRKWVGFIMLGSE